MKKEKKTETKIKNRKFRGTNLKEIFRGTEIRS